MVVGNWFTPSILTHQRVGAILLKECVAFHARRNKTMKYKVGLAIYNNFWIEADNEEEAEEKVRALGVYETLEDAEYDVTYVELED